MPSAQQQTGSIHGHVQDTVGIPMTDGIIGLANPGDKTAKYTFNTDANGDYKGTRHRSRHLHCLPSPG